MKSHPFSKLDIESGGRLILTPCPGTKDVPLELSVKQLKDAGADAIITLMTSEEMERNHVDELSGVCQLNNLPWFHLPIEDDCAPTDEFETRWAIDKKEVIRLLQSGKTMAIHCKGGTGRTGLMAAILLKEIGTDLSDAMNQVKSLRPNSLKLKPHLDYLYQ